MRVTLSPETLTVMVYVLAETSDVWNAQDSFVAVFVNVLFG